MQVPAKQDLAAHLDRLIDEAVPGRRGLAAWGALLEAHATLMRQLQTDLVTKTGVDLNDFDVIFAYPWPDEESLTADLFERCGRAGAVLVTYHTSDELRIRRKTVRSRREDRGQHTR